MSIVICGGGPGTCGGGEWRPIRTYCPWCMEERDGIQRIVFGGYGSDAVCGWCGTWYCDGEADLSKRIPAVRRDENRELVRRVLEGA